MSLHVKVYSCTDVKDVDAGWGKSDTYVVMYCDGETQKTSVVQESLNPKWNEEFDFKVSDPSTTAMHFLCWDSDASIRSNVGVNRDEFIGSVSVVLNALRPSETKKMVLQLLRNGKEKAGTLTVELTARDFSGLAGDL